MLATAAAVESVIFDGGVAAALAEGSCGRRWVPSASACRPSLAAWARPCRRH